MFPGPNTILVMQSVGISGRRAGFYNVFGIVTAVYCNALLSGLGLSLIIMKSVELFYILKMLGACYIVYLGIASLVEACRLNKKEPETPKTNYIQAQDAISAPKSRFACYSKGVITGILNPKSALFFLAFFPQFMHKGGNIVAESIILTMLYSLVSATWYSMLVLFIGKLRQFLIRRETQKWLKATTGTLLVGMGVRIAVQK